MKKVNKFKLFIGAFNLVIAFFASLAGIFVIDYFAGAGSYNSSIVNLYNSAGVWSIVAGGALLLISSILFVLGLNGISGAVIEEDHSKRKAKRYLKNLLNFFLIAVLIAGIAYIAITNYPVILGKASFTLILGVLALACLVEFILLSVEGLRVLIKQRKPKKKQKSVVSVKMKDNKPVMEIKTKKYDIFKKKK